MPYSLSRARALRILAAAATAAVSVLVVWLLVAVNLFYYPQADSEPGQADAVVVLAGAAPERLPVGRDLITDGSAPVLVLSTTGTPGNAVTDTVCKYFAGPAVRCFSPSPLSTRGEARAIARLAADNNWDEIIVVTSTYHLVRAEANISQCSNVRVRMVASEPDLTAGQWLGRFTEETGGVLAAFLRPACASPIG
ncbi:YdcF family protein [Arthrobacter gandavensis]|uniref:YdcF family protein n=1 Tax=Arthrobacter gandavensis TaxID=169960 RepID=UPI00188E853E|nr:ElyC/SanA/YdcF family protein [Arthrobacter gandavensis]MBF4995506.1 YdcF family protein [Arthrobacter gandavensis]